MDPSQLFQWLSGQTKKEHGKPVKMAGLPAVATVRHTRSVRNNADLVTTAQQTHKFESRWF